MNYNTLQNTFPRFIEDLQYAYSITMNNMKSEDEFYDAIDEIVENFKCDSSNDSVSLVDVFYRESSHKTSNELLLNAIVKAEEYRAAALEVKAEPKEAGPVGGKVFHASSFEPLGSGGCMLTGHFEAVEPEKTVDMIEEYHFKDGDCFKKTFIEIPEAQPAPEATFKQFPAPIIVTGASATNEKVSLNLLNYCDVKKVWDLIDRYNAGEIA